MRSSIIAATVVFVLLCGQQFHGFAQSIDSTGIRPLVQRLPETDMGITQQPNDKMQWLLDAKFGMFIHWGLYAGPARGEWYRENVGMPEEEYRKLAYPASGS